MTVTLCEKKKQTGPGWLSPFMRRTAEILDFEISQDPRKESTHSLIEPLLHYTILKNTFVY